MERVGAEIGERYQRLSILPSNEEIGHLLSAYHEELLSGWVGTHDAPGPLLAIALGGIVAGQQALATGKPAAVKALDFGLLIDWSLASQQALDFISKYAFNLIRGIDQTTVEAVRSIEADGVANGLSRDQIARNLNTVFHDKPRSELIAQTEGIRLYNRSAMRSWQTAGVNRARWKTVNDNLVCPLCRRLANQEADLNEGWRDPETGKTYVDIAHPGDRCFRQPIVV